MKNSFIYKIQVSLLFLIGLFPLLKFDWSSKALILFCLTVLISGIVFKSFIFNRQRTERFLLLSSYFLLLILSHFYSTNKEASIKALIQLSPLLIIPFIISFINIKLSNKIKTNALSIFVFGNVIYSFIIIYLFFITVDFAVGDLAYYLGNYDKFQFKINEIAINGYLLIHKPYFSMGFVISAIYCLNLFLLSNSKLIFKNLICLFLFTYFSFWIFYAFSFPNVIALILSVLALLYMKLKKKYFFIFLTVVIFFSTLIVSLKIKDTDVERGFNFIKSSLTDNKYEINDSRKEIYKSYKNILQNSSFIDFIFGFGVGDVQDKLNSDYLNRLNKENTKNLLFFSEELNDSYWFKNNVESFSNQTRSPDSTFKADLITLKNKNTIVSHNLSAKTGLHNIGIYTLSVYAKKNLSNTLILRLGDINQRAIFNLENGAVVQSFNVIDFGIEKLNTDWYRCFITTDLDSEGLVLFGLSNYYGDYNFSSETQMSIYLWGAQFEEGRLSNYKKRGKELLKYASDNKLNTHNNFLFILMATGLIGLALFVVFLGFLFYSSFKKQDILKLSFCLILALNFLTENILSRHWGLMFFAFMLIILFNKQEQLKK